MSPYELGRRVGDAIRKYGAAAFVGSLVFLLAACVGAWWVWIH